MLKTMKCPVRVVWVYRKKTRYVALMTTDMTLSIEQIIEYYGARWKIESGFKEIKQDIGSSKSQVRNAESVMNHLNFCMMATTLTWIQFLPFRVCRPVTKCLINLQETLVYNVWLVYLFYRTLLFFLHIYYYNQQCFKTQSELPLP